MQFTKMHGLGNDYVYVDGIGQTLPEDLPALARRVADRHFGIGGDGLIVIAPSAVGDARMRMFNADGSESEMCGNGVRCVAKFVYDRGISRRAPLQIETGRGLLTLDVTVGPDQRVTKVRVDMGEPLLRPDQIPTTLPGERIVGVPVPQGLIDPAAPWVHASGLELNMTCVSMGNPHVVLYCRDVQAVPLEMVGPTLEHASIFPRRINVHFVQRHSASEVTMRTWERGSGITLACGTGASAVCVAGVLTGNSGRSLLAHLPGGDLELEWSEATGHVLMTGPATEVFTGEWPESAL